MSGSLHPLLIPDILLAITGYLLKEAATPRKRWDHLICLMLIHRRARAILIERPLLWRWIDLRSINHVSLFIERAKGCNIRPLVWATISKTEQLQDLIVTAAALESAEPRLIPEALSLRTRTALITSTLRTLGWKHIKTLVIAPLKFDGRRDTAYSNELFAIDQLTCLESLSVQGSAVAPGWSDHSKLKYLQLFTSYPDFLFNVWPLPLKQFPAIEVLEIRGTFFSQYNGLLEIELPTIRDLRIYTTDNLEDILIKAPRLERAVIGASRRLLTPNRLKPSSMLSPRHLQKMAS